LHLYIDKWSDSVENTQILHLLLLDLCAFAVTQVPENKKQEAMKSYNEACLLAETVSVPHLRTYSDFIKRISYN